MKTPFTLFLFLMLFISIFTVKAQADINQLSSGSREDNSLQQIIDCQADIDCDDHDPCTSESCFVQTINDITLGRCISTGKRADCETPENPPTPVNCDDENACTQDIWSEIGCVFTPIENCFPPENKLSKTDPVTPPAPEEPKTEAPVPTLPETKTEMPLPTVTNPDAIFGGACALNESAHSNTFVWMSFFGVSLLLLRRKILKKRKN